MSGYTVTITPAGDQAGPQTTIQVDTTTGTARVVELTMRAAGRGGLAPQQLPVIDLVGLIAALAPGSTPAITATVEAPVEAQPTRKPRASKGRSAAKAGPRKTTATRTRRRQAAEKASEKASAKTGRAYRRMPDQDEVVTAYRQAGSVGGLAEHFGVPRHTATGWLRRLRGMGVLESAS